MSTLPQDYYEQIAATGQIHGTTHFEEPLDERQAELLAQALRLAHTCRYCNTPIPPAATVCEEHLGQYQQWRKEAKRQARRLCELAREKRANVPTCQRANVPTSPRPNVLAF